MTQMTLQSERDVFLVDDDAQLRQLLGLWLDEGGYRAQGFADASQCLAALEQGERPGVILLDLGMPGMSGEDALKRIVADYPGVVVVILSARTDAQSMAHTTRGGAYDFIPKPVGRERLLMTVCNAMERCELLDQLSSYLEVASEQRHRGLLGKSPQMAALGWQIDRLSATDVNVLIHGESGTGKELVARAIHAASRLHAGPFEALNCASIPESLQDSELFGHERGSFTGATGQRLGSFERAHLGTLFLDEVADLSPRVQSKLLRVLQERSFVRIGGEVTRKVEFRLLAASHRRLRDEVARGRFREDLYFRIDVFELEVPALRERLGDIEVLARHFVRSYAEQLRRPVPRLAAETIQLLERHGWPGNVRELQNVIQRALVTCTSGSILPSDLPSVVLDAAAARSEREPGLVSQNEGVDRRGEPENPVRPPDPARPDPAEPGGLDGLLVIRPGMTLAEVERKAIELALQHCAGNMSQAAEALGIARTTLYRKMKAYERA